MWIVDPLDGTKEFINGIPEFSVAIALIEDGVPILGVTYNPIKREMYWSARGVGCHLNTRRVRVTRTADAQARDCACEPQRNGARRMAGVSRDADSEPDRQRRVQARDGRGGQGDATFTRSPKSEWDIASGAALVAEAGGTITDIKGRALRFNQRNVKLEGLIADNRSCTRR